MSDVRQRKVGEPQAESKEAPKSTSQSASAKKTSSLTWLLIGGVVLLLAVSFAYTNLSNTGSVVQEVIKHMQTPKGLQELQEKWKQDYILGYKDGTVSVQSLRCTPNVDEELNQITAAIGQNVHGIYGFALDDPICSTFTDKGLEYVSQNLAQYYKTLQRLSINFRKIDGISNEGLRHLGKTLDGGLPNLNDLRLTILNNFTNTNITDEGFAHISDALSGNLKNLKTLFIDTTLLKNVTDSSIERLAAAIDKNHRTLTHLVLKFQKNQNLNGDGLVEFANIIENLQDLEILNVNFDFSSKISNEGFQQLVTNIEQLSKLRSLTLNFFACEKISVLGFKQFTTTLASLNLNELAIDFGQCIGITNQIIRQITLTIQEHQHHLEKLSLSFKRIKELSNDALEGVALSLTEKSANLKEFTLAVEASQVTNFGIEKVLEALDKHCKKLEKLTLLFRTALSVTDYTLKKITKIIPTSLTPLKELTLSLGGSEDFSDAALTQLFGNITQHLTGLRHLSLSIFAPPSKATDQCVQAFADGLKNNLPHLEHLAILFTAFEKMTDASLISIADALTHKKNLKTLDLNFAFNPLITDVGVQNLTGVFGSHLPQLEVLILDLANLPKLTDASIRNLPQTFAQRKNPMNKLIMSFSLNPSITDSAIASITPAIGALHGKIQKLSFEFFTDPRRPPTTRTFALEHFKHFSSSEVHI